MPRAKYNVASRRRRKKILKAARGYRGGRSKLYCSAKETVERALRYAYRDRRNRKRTMRKLWIVRINAACRLNGLSYNRFIQGLKKGNIDVNRKMLADLAVNDPKSFTRLTEMAKESLSA
ncbi:MAG: 50S ribosomal protein L20 [Candidatus Glassbacteria bacterium]